MKTAKENPDDGRKNVPAHNKNQQNRVLKHLYDYVSLAECQIGEFYVKN